MSAFRPAVLEGFHIKSMYESHYRDYSKHRCKSSEKNSHAYPVNKFAAAFIFNFGDTVCIIRKVKIVGIILTITYIYIAVVKNVFDKFAVNYAVLICILEFKLVYIGSIRSTAFGKILIFGSAFPYYLSKRFNIFTAIIGTF